MTDMEKISAVYKIVNTVTGDSYIGSSKNVYRRWKSHMEPARWDRYSNNPMYKDMQKYGVDKFDFQIIISIMPECLLQIEQDCIDLMKPTYNSYNAKGKNLEKSKRSSRKTNKKYYNRLCFYNGETLTLNALRHRFQRAGIPHPVLEAKKYLIK